MSETNAERAGTLVKLIQAADPKIVEALETVIAALDEAERRGEVRVLVELPPVQADMIRKFLGPK